MEIKPIFYIWLSYGPISMVFSLITLYQLYKYPEFKSPFYRLVQCDLIINMVCYLHTWLKRIATDEELSRILIPLVTNAQFILNINDFTSQCFYHIQSGSLLVKCIFRYTVAAKPDAPYVWKNYYISIYLADILFSILYTIPYTLASGLNAVHYDAINDTIAYSRNPWGQWFWVMDVQVGIYLLLTFAVGIPTWRRLKGAWNSSKTRKTKLTLIILIDALLHICVWLWHYLPRHFEMGACFRRVMLFCVSDLISCSTPYTLFLLDRTFRRSFWRYFKCIMPPEVYPSGPVSRHSPRISQTQRLEF